MPLTNPVVVNAKPKDKPYKLADEKGMYLLVSQTGKYWRFDYRFQSKRKTLALGVYPDVTLASARTKRDEARRLLANDVDPGTLNKLARRASKALAENSFEFVAREWHAKHSPNWAASHGDKVIRRLELDVFPWLGIRPINEITPHDLLAVLRRVESRGALDTAHRVHQNCGQVFRYAVATLRAERDPSGDLRGALPPARPSHYPSITDPDAIGELLRAINGYQGSYIAKYALQLAPLVFVRPGELRQAEWKEVNFDKAEWRIPAEKMKMKEQHIVPLSTQAVAILRQIEALTGDGRYVFPGARTNGRCMSENTINAALRRLGYDKGQMTGHGFRSLASTLLNEQGWNRDAIERQLAHADRDSIRADYNFAQYLPERRKMMQAWADYLEALASGARVIPFGRKA